MGALEKMNSLIVIYWYVNKILIGKGIVIYG